MGFDDQTTGGALFPRDESVHSVTYVLNEIKRLFIWDSHLALRKREEKSYVAFHHSDTVPSGGGTINLHVANPSDSGVSLDIEKFAISSQFKGQYAIFDGFSTAPSGGSGNGIDNLLLDSAGTDDTGNATITANVDFTADGTHFRQTLASGGQGAGTIGGEGTGTEPIIEPDREVVIQLQNDSSSDNPGSIGVVYSEESTTYS